MEPEKVDVDQLAKTARQLCRRGFGILAADESNSTIGKRLIAHGLPNDSETRRLYRSMLTSSPAKLSQHCSGVILFDETFRQCPGSKSSSGGGETFPAYLQSHGMLPGIKVDTGLRVLSNSPAETYTSGMEDGDIFRARLREYKELGAYFCKWRAALRIDVEKALPSNEAIQRNCDDLAIYARCAVDCGLVPIVEAEVLVDGTHNADSSARVARRVIKRVYESLGGLKVPLEATLLKVMMITPGVGHSKLGCREIGRMTLDVMKEVVPAEVAGIMFLSGGMSEIEVTSCLNELNVLKALDKECTWKLSFSFGRALQASALRAWAKHTIEKSDDEDVGGDTVAMVVHANGLATMAAFHGKHPCEGGGAVSLHEHFRGWRGSGDVEGI